MKSPNYFIQSTRIRVNEWKMRDFNGGNYPSANETMENFFGTGIPPNNLGDTNSKSGHILGNPSLLPSGKQT